MSVGREQAPFGVIFGGREVVGKTIEYTFIVGSLAIGSVAAIVWALYHPITWIEITALLMGYVIINIGVGLALHRHFSHESFKTYPAVRYVLGAFGAMSCQGSMLKWAADHRRHHAHTDSCGDIHSPHIDAHCRHTNTWWGLLYGHIAWLFDDTTTDLSIYGKGLADDPVVMFYHRTRWVWFAFSLVIFPGAFGYAFGGFEHMTGAILVGGFLRTFVFLNFVLAVNSIGHRWGSERYPQDNHSKNNYLLGVLTFGDGFHNNHHYFPRAAMAAHRWWEADVNGWLIHGLEKVGLAWDVVRVPEHLKHGGAGPMIQDNPPPKERAVA